MTIENGSEPLRDTISAAFDTVTADEPAPAAVPAEATPAPPVSEQPRDEAGRFAPKPEEAKHAQPQQQPAPQAQPPVERKRPSTWKKEMWDHYDKLDPQLADYILQREQEYTRGVSTYAQEWQRAKPLMEAIAPFEATLKQYNLDPAKHTANLMAAHQQLALGTPEQKLAMFARLAQDYQVPLGNLLYQAQDGQWYMQQPQQPAPQPGLRPEDIDGRVKSILEQQQIDTEVNNFGTNHPHFDAVRETMGRLLDAGIANGLEDAYARALRMPEHDTLSPPTPAPQEEARKRAEAARRNAVSPRSATPLAASAPASGKDLRATIENAFDHHTAGRL